MGEMITKIMASILVAALSSATISEAQAVKSGDLNAKQENIIAIAAFTANGDLQKLRTALNEGLDAGPTACSYKLSIPPEASTSTPTYAFKHHT